MTFGFQRHSFHKFSSRLYVFYVVIRIFKVEVGHINVRAKYVGGMGRIDVA
jgi:hypothetical protein